MDAQNLIQSLHALRHETQHTREYWQRMADAFALLTRATSALLLAFSEENRGWFLLNEEPEDLWLQTSWPERIREMAERTQARGFAMEPLRDTLGRGHLFACIRIQHPSFPILLLLDIPDRERSHFNELVLRAQLLSDLPLSSQSPSPAAQDSGDHFLPEMLEMIVRVMQEKHFGAAALTLVNHLVADTHAAQVTLGWTEGVYVRCKAISHLDRFENYSDNVRLLEAALEEAADQETAIDYPADAENHTGIITLAHEKLCQALGYRQVYTLPIRPGTEKPLAVLLLAVSGQENLNPQQLQALSIAAGLLLPWLGERYANDRWFGARLWHRSRKTLEDFLGPHHLLQKLLALGVSLLTAYILLGTWPYRVNATGHLVTDSVRVISAPFEGYLDHVYVNAGDEIREETPMALLGREELLLQESEIRSEIRRYQSEADKARAAYNAADVEISRAMLSQAQARLERVLYRLDKAEIRAPFSGVVVEGEKMELLGAPVTLGQGLFRLARIEGLYVELHIPENDIHLVHAGSTGEMALVSQPDKAFAFTIEAIIPQAKVKGTAGNHFVAKARLLENAADWWRPGMSGVTRIDVGDKPIYWILGRRTLDALHLKFWW